MTTKYRAQTRATASSPHGTTVVEDGKEDNTQKLALLLGQALTCHSHTDKESVCIIHAIRYGDVCIVYMRFVCVWFIYAHFYLSVGYSWNLTVFQSIHCEIAVI